jgi:hypothetical protein
MLILKKAVHLFYFEIKELLFLVSEGVYKCNKGWSSHLGVGRGDSNFAVKMYPVLKYPHRNFEYSNEPFGSLKCGFLTS